MLLTKSHKYEVAVPQNPYLQTLILRSGNMQISAPPPRPLGADNPPSHR